MIDVHCHLNFHSFEKDYEEVMQRAFQKGVNKIINTGTQLDSSQWAVELAEKYAHLYAIVGVHPHHADKIDVLQQTPSPLRRGQGEVWIQQLETLIHHPKVIGIGECGLDYFSYKSNGIVDPKVQKDVFEQQIMLAHRAGLPLQIHNRQAGEDVIDILLHHKSYLLNPPGMFHCFAGSFEVLKAALELGFYIGFDGNITYKGLAPGETTALPDLAKYTPLDRIVCETDSPFLTPIPHRGTRNEPQYVILIAEEIARIKGISYTEVVEQTDKNVYTIFNRINK